MTPRAVEIRYPSNMAFAFDPRDGARDDSARLVDRLVRHGAVLSTRELLSRVLTPRTRYLVFDLDRTLYFQRNIGELLGWEIVARHAYGAEALPELEARRGPGRWLFDRSRPWGGARYLARGAVTWAYPGLYYLLWGKIVPKIRGLAHYRYLRFGEEPQLRAQRMPALALLHDLAAFDLDTVLEMTQAVLRRHANDEVVSPEDIAWLRRTYPELTIVLSSASPEPVVRATAARYGIELLEATTFDMEGERLASPHVGHPLFYASRRPARLGRPERLSINGGQEKTRRLLARFGDFLDVETVGVTDTGHEEDHAWASCFTRVVDVNSPTPFPVIVGAQSPLREVHSAQVLTRAEADGEVADPRRAQLPYGREPEGVLDAVALAAAIGPELERARDLVRLHARALEAPAAARRGLEARLAGVRGEMSEAVAAYNTGDAASAAQLRRLQRAEDRLERERAHLGRPAARLRYELDRLSTVTRRALRDRSAPGLGRRWALA